MIEKFLEKTSFESYNDFMRNFKVKVPENFNFGYDVVDAMAGRLPTSRPCGGPTHMAMNDASHSPTSNARATALHHSSRASASDVATW